MLEPMGLAAGPVVPTREWRELYGALDCAAIAAIHPFYSASVREFELAGRPIVGSAPVGVEGTTAWLESIGKACGVPGARVAAAKNALLPAIKAALDQAQANLKLAQVTWDRDRPLVKEGWTTQQQGTVDVQTLKAQEAAVSVAQANVAAQENLLKMLHQNRDYASVVAPFDGVITQRNVDVGSLVQGNATTGTFMFEMMQRDVIRVWVYVPQDAAFGVAPGASFNLAPGSVALFNLGTGISTGQTTTATGSTQCGTAMTVTILYE